MNFSITQNEIEFIIRIFLAAICGCFIGIERKIRLKEAGMRTHLVVAFGAALFMIVSKYGFDDMIKYAVESNNDLVKFDPTRIASTIVTGIGFLGAGTIFVRKNVINGLTTAAGLWSTAAIGMAIGAGMYFIGIASTLMLSLLQLILHTKSIFNKTSAHVMKFKISQVEKPIDSLLSLLSEKGIKVVDINFEKVSEFEYKIDCITKIPSKLNHIKLADELSAVEFVKGLEF